MSEVTQAKNRGIAEPMDLVAAMLLDGMYEAVAASQSNQVMGPTGGVGDRLTAVIIIPTTTSPGNLQIKDGSNSAITLFAGGASSVPNLLPIVIPLHGIQSVQGAWQITTGANMSAIGIGNFS